MSGGKKQALLAAFDGRLKLEFHGSKVNFVAGLLAYQERDAPLCLTDLGEFVERSAQARPKLIAGR